MTRRMIHAGIWANENFAGLCPMARLLQIGIITLADDQGRAKANPAYLRSQIFPYDDVSLVDTENWLNQMSLNGTIQVYTVNGKTYLQLLNWWDYQSPSFAAASIYPRPDGWHDRIRFTGKGRVIYTCNWINSNGELLPNTCDENGNPIPRNGQPPVPPSEPNSPAPHGQPPDTPYGQPHEPLNEYKNKNEYEGEYVRARETVAEQPPPPSVDTTPWIASKAEYLPGIADPRGRTSWQEQLNKQLDASVRVPLSNAVAELLGATEAIDAGDDGLNKKCQTAAVTLHRMGCTPDSLESLSSSWWEDYRSKGGTPSQLIQFVSEARASHKRQANAPPPQPVTITVPSFPSLLS